MKTKLILTILALTLSVNAQPFTAMAKKDASNVGGDPASRLAWQDAVGITYRPDITTLTTGLATSLDGAYSPTTADIGIIVQVDLASGGEAVYKLRAGTNAENSPLIVRPDNYAPGTNEVVWEKVEETTVNLPRVFEDQADFNNTVVANGFLSVAGGALGLGDPDTAGSIQIYDSASVSYGELFCADTSSGPNWNLPSTIGGDIVTDEGDFTINGNWIFNNQIDASSTFVLCSQLTTAMIDDAGAGYVLCDTQLDVVNFGLAFGTYGNFNQAASDEVAFNGASDTVLRMNGSGGGSSYLAVDVNFQMNKTITPGGTTGAVTIDKNAGSVNFAAAGATSFVVTNDRVTTDSVILTTVSSNDTTLKYTWVVPAAGSFTIYANAAATNVTRVNFLVIN